MSREKLAYRKRWPEGSLLTGRDGQREACLRSPTLCFPLSSKSYLVLMAGDKLVFEVLPCVLPCLRSPTFQTYMLALIK